MSACVPTTTCAAPVSMAASEMCIRDSIKGVQQKIEWGSQIRSYVFMPYTLAKDTRTGFENAIAGSSLALNVEYFTYDIANAFAQAAVTFTSQNYGAGDLRRCKKIFRCCMLFGVVFTEILSAVFIDVYKRQACS